METESTTMDEAPDDGLEIVRSINKYLRKALKKIETIQKASESLSEEACYTPHKTNSEHLSNSDVSDSNLSLKSHRNRRANRQKSPEMKNKCLERPDAVDFHRSSNFRETGENLVISCNAEINAANRPHKKSKSKHLSHDKSDIVGSQSESCIEYDTRLDSEDDHAGVIELDSDCGEDVNENLTIVNAPRIPLTNCTVSKLEWPLIDSDPILYNQNVCIFFKAFIKNLPLHSSIADLKTWLKIRGVSNYEDIIVLKKPNFKTCVISFGDKFSRDQLLLLDGEMFDDIQIEIRKFVDNTADEGNHQTVQSDKKAKKRARKNGLS